MNRLNEIKARNTRRQETTIERKNSFSFSREFEHKQLTDQSLEDVNFLINELERLQDEFEQYKKGSMLLLAYQAKRNGGELILSQDFIQDHSHQDIEMIEDLDPLSMNTVYRFRFK